MRNRSAAVVVQIAGGLGNQLFQYATARRLAFKSDLPLILDHVSAFARDSYRRKLMLPLFNVRAEYIRPSASYASWPGRVRRRVDRLLGAMVPLPRSRYLREKPGCFYPQLLDWRPVRGVYLEGYWQSEDYFRDIRPQLLEELTLIAPHDAVNQAVADRITSTNAVCVHVRLMRKVLASGGTASDMVDRNADLTGSYYTDAMRRLAERVDRPHFYVFSDNPDQARTYIRSDCPLEFISHNDQDHAQEDLWLMSLCRHFIIAWSTFSWWGAWLGRAEEKVVIAPRAGYGDDPHLLPPEWMRV